jgi:ankyrin repeat protein
LHERLSKQLFMTALLDQRKEVFEYLNTLQPVKQWDLDSALHFRTLFGDLRFVKILVEAGADTSSKEDGLTPLEQALVRKREEVVQYLRPLSPKPRRSWQLFFI